MWKFNLRAQLTACRDDDVEDVGEGAEQQHREETQTQQKTKREESVR